MSLYKNLLNTVQDETDFIDLSVNKYQKKIEKTLIEVNNKITKMLTDYTKIGHLKKVNFEFALINKAQIENLLKSSGYYSVVEGLLENQLNLIDDIVKEYDLFDYKLQFTNINKEAIKELIKNSSVVFGNIGVKATSQIYNGIYNSLITDVPLSAALSAVRSAIADTKLKQYAGTYLNTEYMNFNRTVTNLMSEQTGWERFQFVGPIDAKLSHDFCLKHVGEIMTKKQIDKYSKQYGFDIYYKGGGWNCRHKWVAVPDDYKISQREKTMIQENLKIAKMNKELKKAA